MGYDITFHPVSRDDLAHFVFDVAKDPSLAPIRANELCVKPEDKEFVVGMYRQFPEWLSESKRSGFEFGPTFGQICASVAGYRHPYWYSRGSAISFLVKHVEDIGDIFSPLASFAMPPHLIAGNYSASGFIEHRDLMALHKVLDALGKENDARGVGLLSDIFDEKNLESLFAAWDYAHDNKLGLMEASDLVVPLTQQFSTFPDNLRAHYLKNVAEVRLVR